VGTHSTAKPEETLLLSEAIDAVTIGEYDYIIEDLAKYLKDKNGLDTVSSIAYRKGEEIIRNRNRVRIKELDRLPFISKLIRKHLNYKNYYLPEGRFPMAIITSRGCPYKCHYCIYPQVMHGHEFRARSPENVVDEMEYIAKEWSEVEEIGIEDDCFTIDIKRVEKICGLLEKRKLKINWYCNSRGDLKYNLLKKMKKAGCTHISVGFDSGCQTVLNNIGKEITIEQYKQFCRDASKAGIFIHGCFLIGNPGENLETVAMSYKLAKKTKSARIRFYPLYLHPGTGAHEWAENNGYVEKDEISEWLGEDGLQSCTLNNPSLLPEKLVSLSNIYERKYCYRPGYLFTRLFESAGNPLQRYHNKIALKNHLYKTLKNQVHKSRRLL